MTLGETDLDALSNRTLDAIEAGAYAQALTLCRRLLHRYPDAFDGHARFANLRLAQGRFQEAANHYDVVLEMLHQNPDGVDPDFVHYVTELRDQALAQAQP
jgi:tetratricopeptide (TPR) repeat protein